MPAPDGIVAAKHLAAAALLLRTTVRHSLESIVEQIADSIGADVDNVAFNVLLGLWHLSDKRCAYDDKDEFVSPTEVTPVKHTMFGVIQDKGQRLTFWTADENAFSWMSWPLGSPSLAQAEIMGRYHEYEKRQLEARFW